MTQIFIKKELFKINKFVSKITFEDLFMLYKY